MKIVIAPDSFKESLSALEAAHAIERGFKTVFPDAEYRKLPMADGGEGTVQSLIDSTNGWIKEQVVTGPMGEQVKAFFGMMGDGKTAVIEMAAASGLHLVPVDKRNPLVTTTRGTGELIAAALDAGAERLIIGIGGSATNDGGAGMIQALGGRLLDDSGRELGAGGGALSQLASIDVSGLDSRLQNVKLEVACDVDNPLTGPRGASAVFGPQKGATDDMVGVLDQNLAHFADVAEKVLGSTYRETEGAGAAGGLGWSLLVFLHADLKRGIDIVLEAVDFENEVQDADLVITGEGRIDSQTIYGKTPIGVAKVAKSYDVPVIGIAGSVSQDSDAVYQHGIDALFSIVPGVVSLEDAFEHAAEYMERTARDIAASIKLAKTSK
ncbi:glycerate kinase [Bacillus atrophaeus]|uniref:glycerate kinase n=1 Tax=Bacillus atrophaeus TaxID=1452 RepID=UPI0022813E86|nr:glycerate kinase [Bacillus atrophaeus]MCY8498594.1 glycerate kinase [Bacillus atrophaeus]MCY8811626.1 glycerate kinase [Bacillus atrophaeus]MCY8819290.1 glycerate kinase [Bacillus atrophaeus]MCY8830363.1 glycerate kinase [Bacillus atrophaeus]MCY8832290.1 glycerate kinase [Bacillus atrophaeus]